jgi:hypothetical protein
VVNAGSIESSCPPVKFLFALDSQCHVVKTSTAFAELHLRVGVIVLGQPNDNT